MSDLDTRLTAALNADAPPAQDARFRVEVLLRIERARFKRKVIRSMTIASVAAALVVVNAHAIEAWITADMWRVGIVALGTVSAMFILSGLPIEAFPGVRSFAHKLGRWLQP